MILSIREADTNLITLTYQDWAEFLIYRGHSNYHKLSFTNILKNSTNIGYLIFVSVTDR